MGASIAIKVDVTKIDKTAIYEGKKGKYVDMMLVENKDGADQYGNDGFVSQGLSKERREAGERGPIIGNWRRIKTKTTTTTPKQEAKTNYQAPDDDVPF